MFLQQDKTKKIVLDQEVLQTKIFACRVLKAKIVLTIGSWDMLHIGHCRYLEKARSYGDVLIVGVDSDDAIKRYKGAHRPLIPEVERCEMLSNLPYVDFITTVNDVDEGGRWQYGLARLIKPDVFVAVRGSYPDEQCREIERHTERLEVLERQAQGTSSSEIFKKIIKDPEVLKMIAEAGEART